MSIFCSFVQQTVIEEFRLPSIGVMDVGRIMAAATVFSVGFAKVGVDPAPASGPVSRVIQDVLGVAFILLNIAATILRL